MTELEYVLNNFDAHFSQFRKKNIVLHGSRNYAEAIIDRFKKSYNFAGVMSMDPLEGTAWHGLPIISEEDLEKGRYDLVILTERVKYAEAAFQKIRLACKYGNIEIYNMYGLNEFQVHYEADISRPLTLEKAAALCRPYDVIAFEVMNTIFQIPFPNLPADSYELIPGKMVPELISGLRAEGKQIRFSLRKSYPEEKQIRALRDHGFLQNEEKELIRRTGEDLSFRTLKESEPGEKILYIGIGLVNEFILPRCYGIDTIMFIDRNSLNSALFFDSLRPKCLAPERKPFAPGEAERVRELIKKHTLISFDIFDTLLLRKTLFPRDVFELTECKAVESGYAAEGFSRARAKAEEHIPYCSLDEIYHELADLYGWDRKTREAVKQIELDAERSVLEPRTAVVSLLDFALKQGKRVVLTSDMYLPEPVLRKLLKEKGIDGYEKIFVSCDQKRAKYNGLFSQLPALCPDPSEILHIGDNPDADGIPAEKTGIDTLIIPSSLSLAKENGWRKPSETAYTLMERCLLGLTICHLFSDPFRNPNISERTIAERMEHLGNSVIGPFMSAHMCWLIRKLITDRYDGVLFLARDGWLPLKLYEEVRGKMSLPRGIYYYANRHSSFLCCADEKFTAAHIDKLGRSFDLSTEQLLEKVYLIPKDKQLLREYGDLSTEFIERHYEMIHETAERARKGYLRYSRQLGMRAGEKYAVVDFIAVGNTQKYLSKALPFTLRGFYYGTYSSTEVDDNVIEYYLQGDNPALLKEYINMESFFSSPEPAVDHMAEDGIPVFAQEVRDEKDLRNLGLCWETALSFSREFFRLFYQPGKEIISGLIEEMYAAVSHLGNEMPVYDDWFGTEVNKRPS